MTLLQLLESADDLTLQEIRHEAESLLDGQLQAAIAADQRALTYSGLLVAAVGALIGFASATTGPTKLIVIVATILGVSAAAALWSARPTPWIFKGTMPNLWQRDLTAPRPTLRQSLADLLNKYDGALESNFVRMNRAARAMRISLMMTAAGVGVGLVGTWITVLC